MADQSVFGVLALREQIIDNARVAYGYMAKGPTVSFDIVLASERSGSNRRNYHGYVVYGRQNKVFIHTPRKDQIYEVYRSLLEASAEMVQFLVDEKLFADPDLEKGGFVFYDAWVNRKLGDEHELDSQREDHPTTDEGGSQSMDDHRLSSDENDHGTQFGSDFTEFKAEHQRVQPTHMGDVGLHGEYNAMNASRDSGLKCNEQNFADDADSETHESIDGESSDKTRHSLPRDTRVPEWINGLLDGSTPSES